MAEGQDNHKKITVHVKTPKDKKSFEIEENILIKDVSMKINKPVYCDIGIKSIIVYQLSPNWLSCLIDDFLFFCSSIKIV